jgi:hypothetical protein
MEVVRRSLPRRDVAAALRAIEAERLAAMKALTDRRQTAAIIRQSQRQIDRAADRFAAKILRAEAKARPVPT